MAKFKSLREIEDASIAEFSDIRGIGSAKIAQLKSAFELGKRLIMDGKGKKTQEPSFKDSSQVYEYYMPKLSGLKKEKFLCSLLDSKNRVFKETVV
jgi:DNA repair protein RadC